METVVRILVAIGLVILGFFIGALIEAWPLMLLWNWLMPTIFGLIKITFWQAFGLVFLCSMLFKSVNSSK